MVVAITTVVQRDDMHVVTVEATADGDTNVDIQHTLGVTPRNVTITQLNDAAAAARLSDWVWDQVNTNANQVRLVKTNAVGSGAAGEQIQVNITRSHHVQIP